MRKFTKKTDNLKNDEKYKAAMVYNNLGRFFVCAQQSHLKSIGMTVGFEKTSLGSLKKSTFYYHKKANGAFTI